MARNPRSGTSNKPAESPGHFGEPFSTGTPAPTSGAKPNFFGPKGARGRDVFVGMSKSNSRANLWTNGGNDG